MAVGAELAGRRALVTGGSGGIGAAICRALAADSVAVGVGYGRGAEAAQGLVDELRARGVVAAAFGADMEDPIAPSSLVDEVERQLGPLDILVANHGLARSSRLDELDAETFDRTLAVNLRAPFLLAQRVLSGMRERGFGRILFISSTAAFRGGVIGADYTASKAGLNGLVHYLAAQVSGDGVTVNALAPGFVETAMLPGDASQLAESVPLGRVGRPEEVADLALAVLRNGYMTNKVIGIDGGMHPR